MAQMPPPRLLFRARSARSMAGHKNAQRRRAPTSARAARTRRACLECFTLRPSYAGQPKLTGDGSVSRTTTTPSGTLGIDTPTGNRRFRRRLLSWYDRVQRDLPWRESRDPYRAWLSEIMLQQTRVAAVVEHYKRFLKDFPTVAKLAAARESSVLAAW